jgi:uncharacterized membrane protein YcaP (DUF421 family)
MDVAILLLRTLFFYGLILLVTKTFTKNRKITLIDLLVSFMISELSVLAIDRPGQPLAISFLPIILLLALHLLLTFILKRNVNTLDRQTSKAANDMVAAKMRPRFADVEMGLMEPATIVPPVQNLPIPLILDGKVMDSNLEKIGKTRFWLKNQVQNYGARRFKEVAYCSIDGNGKIFLDKKEH